MSKANRAFVRNEEAVSPVIGVILMVAITVVLAAVVFVLVSNLGKGSESAPTFQLSREEDTDRLSVLSADSDADWNRLAASVSGQVPSTAVIRVAGGHDSDVDTPGACGAAAASDDAFTDAEAPCNLAATGAEITSVANPMGAGEYLEFCTDVVAGATSVTVTIVDTAANQQIGSFTFQNIAACAGT